MGRKIGFMGRKADVVDKVDVFDDEVLRASAPDPDQKEELVFTGPSDWTPEQAEQFIDWRIQLVEAEISRLREELEAQTAKRRRWLSVTGGRSKLVVNGNGHTNGNGNETSSD